MDVALHGTEDMRALSCSSYNIPLTALLVPVSVPLSAKMYFQEVSSWPESVNTTAVCRWSGTEGGMQLLSAFNQSHLVRIWPKTMHALGILQAVYLMQTFNDLWISFTITGQLVDLERMGLAAWALPSQESGASHVGYYLCKCTFASPSARAVASIREQTAELLSDLSNGGLVLGLDPGVGRPPPPSPIHPDIYVNLSHTESASFISDLQSLAIAEWKRLNR